MIFSLFNEEDVLQPLLERTVNALKDCDEINGFEVIFVNDASTDNSESVIRNLIETSKENITLLNTSRNFGIYECVYAGFSHATGDAIVYLDSDLQDPPELIPQLVKEFLEKKAEVVFTTRRKREGESKFKLLFTKIGYRFLAYVSDIDLPVDSGDFKLISRRIKDILLDNQEKLPYLRGLISYYGFKQVSVLYDREPRFNGGENTKFKFLSRRTINYWLDSALISFSDVPLKMSLVLGFVTALLAGVYLIFVLLQKVMGLHVPGWPAIMATMLILGGTQLIMLGFFGLYLKVIFLESKGRPNFIIKDVIQSKK